MSLGNAANLGELMHACVDRYGDRPFLTIAETGVTTSYTEFGQLTNRLAHGLLNQFERDSRYVAIMLENGIEFLAASYALKKTDLVEVAINRAFRGPALSRMINLTGARILFTSDEHVDALAQIKNELPNLRTLIMVGDTARARAELPEFEIREFDDVLADNDAHLPSSAAPLDTAAIMFTSGTTGVSKGCVLSHRYAITTAENVIPPFRVTADDCVYSPYPLSHIGPAYYDILPSMLLGARVVLRNGFSLSNFWPEVSRYDVTWFMMLGSVQQLLWSAPERPEERDHKVTRCWATPAPVPKADFDARFGLHLIPGGGYGSTDAGWVVVPQWDHPGGVVLPNYDVKIVDDNGAELPPGTPGELLVRGHEPGLTADEYFGLPEVTEKCWVDGWFRTGDIAHIDADGLFYFRHRKSERIRVRGEMVSAYEIEEGVLTHPHIEDCAAVAVAGEMVEEDVRVFVVLKRGHSLTADEVKEHCAARMAKFMVPRDVIFLDDLPRTPTGKPDKGTLSRM